MRNRWTSISDWDFKKIKKRQSHGFGNNLRNDTRSLAGPHCITDKRLRPAEADRQPKENKYNSCRDYTRNVRQQENSIF